MPDTDVITATPTPETASLPDDFIEFQAARRAGDRGEQPEPKEETKSPAAAEKKPVETETPPAKTAKESGTEEEEKQEQGKDDEPAEKPEKPDKVQKRFDKLTREKYELKGRIATLEEQLKAEKPAKESLEKAEPKADEKPAVGVAPVGKPKVEEFENYEDFTEALTDWKLNEREKIRAEEVRQKETRAAHNAEQSAWDTQLAATKGTHPDYDDKMAEVDDVELTPHSKYAIFKAGPEVAYYLAEHREELERIAKLSPFEVAMAVGRIAGRFASPDKPASETKSQTSANGQMPPLKVTSAPKPISAVGGGAAAGTPSIHDPAVAGDFTLYKKVRRAQERDR